MLRCLPLALAPADSALRSRCAACLSDAAGGAACAGGCGSVLCVACATDARWAATHAAGECVSLRHLWTLLGRTHDGAVSAASGGGASAAAAAAAVGGAPAAAATLRNKRRRAGASLPPTAAPQTDSAALRVLMRLAYVRALEAAPGALPPYTDCPRGDALADDVDAADELVSHFEALSDAQARWKTRAIRAPALCFSSCQARLTVLRHVCNCSSARSVRTRSAWRTRRAGAWLLAHGAGARRWRARPPRSGAIHLTLWTRRAARRSAKASGPPPRWGSTTGARVCAAWSGMHAALAHCEASRVSADACTCVVRCLSQL